MIIKPVLSDNKRSDGSRNIRLYIYDKRVREKAFVSTDYYCHPGNWVKGKLKNVPEANFINSKIQILISGLQERWLKDDELTPKDLVQSKSDLRLFEFVDQLVAFMGSRAVLNRGQPFSPNTIKSYVTYSNYLKAFNPKLNWKDVTEGFYDEYMNFLRDRYKPNTMAKAIKILISIMRRGRKYHSNTAYLNFKASYIDTDTLALSPEKIEKIMKAKLPDHLISERDRFYLSYNLLLRFGDSINIKKTDILKKEGKSFISFIHEKTRNQVMIPLFERSLEILKKYDYSLPYTTNQEANWKLKEIGRLSNLNDNFRFTKYEKGKASSAGAEEWSFITTHTARRSMATNLYLAGFDLKQIQLMGGWKSVAVLEKYLKVDRLQNALKASKHPFFN